jgi:hypothetical protein
MPIGKVIFRWNGNFEPKLMMTIDTLCFSLTTSVIYEVYIFNCGNRPILHKYANEDVALGSWFIGLEVEHIDDRSMCCETPPGIISKSITYCLNLGISHMGNFINQNLPILEQFSAFSYILC